MSDTTEYPPNNPYPAESPLRVVPKATLNSLMLDKMEDTSIEVAHLSNTVQAQTEYLVELVTSAKWLLLLLTAALLLNTMLLLAILVTVSFLFGALR